ncbi:tyrosine-type recombinase/integrase [Wukongibacter baidiensis]|uniref:tyrosine-type recombinase/integrase n=1 Tax=Wukongibacter baidiensis TaxID=1723361 RepID=UPI003D7F8BF9
MENYLSTNTIRLLEDFVSGFKLDRTKKDYVREIEKFCYFIEKDFLEITYEDCNEYIDYLNRKVNEGVDDKLRLGKVLFSTKKNKISVATAEKVYSYLFSFANHVQGLKSICDFIPDNFSNFFKRTDKPKAKRNISQEKIISWDELDKLITALKEYNTRDYLALMLIFTSGLTVRETINLRWNQIFDDANGNVGIRFKLPNGHERLVKVNSDIAKLLEEYRLNQRPVSHEEYVFLNKFNKPISSRWIRLILERACKDAKLKNSYSPRDLRHTAAYMCLKYGASKEQTMEQFGWTDIRFADRYPYSVPELQDNAIDYINFKLKP